MRLLVAVGHEKEEGALCTDGWSEWTYHDKVAQELRLRGFTDIISITHSIPFWKRSAAIMSYAEKCEYDHVLELHLNRFTKEVTQRQEMLLHSQDESSNKFFETLGKSWERATGLPYRIKKRSSGQSGYALLHQGFFRNIRCAIWEPFFLSNAGSVKRYPPTVLGSHIISSLEAHKESQDVR